MSLSLPGVLHVGQITRLSGTLACVTVPTLDSRREYGPIEGLPDKLVPSGGSVAYAPTLAVGDRVLVGLVTLSGGALDVFIIRKLGG